MMSFCKKSVHSFLSLTTINTITTTARSTTDHHRKPPCKCGLGLITFSSSDDDHDTSPNIIDCSSLLKLIPPTPIPPPPPPLISSSMEVITPKKDPGGIGFIDEIGGGVDGLMSCTESLGFESCDERRVDDHQIDQMMGITSSSSTTTRLVGSSKKKNNIIKEAKTYPPPLSSFNHNGQPSFFLRPVRKDGRLELTEVRIHPPEILRASRQDGRLRLHLIAGEDDLQEEEEEEEELLTEKQQELEEEEEEETKHEEEEEKEWKFPVSGEGFRRSCHELVMSQHQHQHNQFITII